MTEAQIIAVINQKIGQAVSQILGENPQFTDDFLFEYIETAFFDLESFGVETGVVVDKEARTITPNSTTMIGMLIALNVSSALVNDYLLEKLRSGEMGVAFRTGTVEITTNQAAINLTSAGKDLQISYKLLLTRYFAGDPEGLIQRAQ